MSTSTAVLRKFGASVASRPAAVSTYWAQQVGRCTILEIQNTPARAHPNNNLNQPRFFALRHAHTIPAPPQHAHWLQQPAETAEELPKEVAREQREQHAPRHVRYPGNGPYPAAWGVHT